MQQKSNIVTAFNNHFADFVNDICTVFPNDVDLISAKNTFVMIRKANPRMTLAIWEKYVNNKYSKEIEKGDISFFLSKNYMVDLTNSSNPKKIVEAIDRLRTPILSMSHTNQQKIMKYMQNLSKISQLYTEL